MKYYLPFLLIILFSSCSVFKKIDSNMKNNAKAVSDRHAQEMVIKSLKAKSKQHGQ